MKKYNVIHCDVNARKIEEYDVMPYFANRYKECKKSAKPKTYDECRLFVEAESRYMFWSRCEYEVIIQGWPDNRVEAKWDIHRQIMMNLDLVVGVFMENVGLR